MSDFDHNELESKQRSLRIGLDYPLKRDWIRTAKQSLAALFAALSLAYVGYVSWASGQADDHAGAMQLSPGPLANAHAGLDNKCSACHAGFAPLDDDATAVRQINRFLQLSAADFSADQKCSACHMGGDGRGLHHANSLAADAVTCSACHTDHQGRAAAIAQADSSRCLHCHADMRNHHTASEFAAAPIDNVTGFGAPPEHPKFRSLPAAGRDPGTIQFNHAFHLLPPELRERPDAEPARQQTLNCAGCHELEPAKAATTAANATTQPTAGRYMLPISFERHCQTCHPLNIPGEIATAGSLVTVPHGLSLAATHQTVRGQLVAKTVRDTEHKALDPNRPIPGKTPGNNQAQNLPDDLASNVVKNLAALYDQSCWHCHVNTDSKLPGSRAPQEIAPAPIPQVWLRHARFDHSAHRAVDCAKCHQDAYLTEDTARLFRQKVAELPSVKREPADQSEFVRAVANLIDDTHGQVMIPNLEVCAECHTDRNRSQLQQAARTDCTECHTYHHGDRGPDVAPTRKNHQAAVKDSREAGKPARAASDERSAQGS